MEIIIENEAAMQRLGSVLAQTVVSPLVIELIGDVGAGKTTLTRALARELGVKGPVQSPTFTISNRYELRDGRVLAHYDFYRLGEPGIMSDELDETIRDTHTLTVIEWGDIVADVLPDDRLTLEIVSPTETSRIVRVTGRGTATALAEEVHRVFTA